MKILMTGSSGLAGSSLVEYLFLQGYCLYCLQRNMAPAASQFWNINALEKIADGNFQAIIHLPEENLLGDGWAEGNDQLLTSAMDGTRQLIDYITTLEVKPRVFLGASAVSFYGNRADEVVDESSSPGEGLMADISRLEEQETQRLVAMGIRVVNLRCGLILNPTGGTLQSILPPFQTHLDGITGSEKKIISWISIRDLAASIDFIIHHSHLHGPINIVSPNPTTYSEFARARATFLNQPAIFRLAEGLIQAIRGRMARTTPLSSCRAIPRVLLESGYEFSDPSLDALLRSWINR